MERQYCLVSSQTLIVSDVHLTVFGLFLRSEGYIAIANSKNATIFSVYHCCSALLWIENEKILSVYQCCSAVLWIDSS